MRIDWDIYCLLAICHIVLLTALWTSWKRCVSTVRSCSGDLFVRTEVAATCPCSSLRPMWCHWKAGQLILLSKELTKKTGSESHITATNHRTHSDLFGKAPLPNSHHPNASRREPYDKFLVFLEDWCNVPALGCSPAEADTYQARATWHIKMVFACGCGLYCWCCSLCQGDVFCSVIDVIVELVMLFVLFCAQFAKQTVFNEKALLSWWMITRLLACLLQKPLVDAVGATSKGDWVQNHPTGSPNDLWVSWQRFGIGWDRVAGKEWPTKLTNRRV